MGDVEFEETVHYEQSREFACVVIDYSKAFKAVALQIPPKVKSILVEHFRAPDRRLSIFEMGQIAGYKGSRAGSLQYGLFAGRLAEAMNQEPPGANKISIIGRWDSTPDSKGHGGWVMYEEVAAALEDIGWVSSEFDDNGEYIGASNATPAQTSRVGEAVFRMGQDVFRRELLNYWEACSVTGCTLHEVLIASHIQPWSASSSAERLDVFNGLLLTPNLDRLFDQALISFDSSGLILVSPSLSTDVLKALGVHYGMKLRKLDSNHLPYLEKHSKRFREINQC